MRMIRLLLLSFLLVLAACAGGRQGIVISGDGTVADNTPERAKAHAEQMVAEALDRDSVAVAITPLPRWQSESRARAEGWYWDMARIDITVPGTVTDEERAELIDAARDSLDGAVTGGSASLLVTVSTSALAPVATPALITAPMAAMRRYAVLSGDTMADISTAFYGTPQYWRAILAANPGLDPANLVTGMQIVIPAKP